MLYMLGLMPEDDNEFLDIVELREQRSKEMKKCSKVCNLGESKPSKNSIEIDKDKQKVINQNEDNNKKRKRKQLINAITKKKKIINLKRKNILR
jgi:hypothetical protein